MKSACILALSLALSACATPSSGPLPDWVDAPHAHPECARQDFLSGVGIAPGESEAPRELARQRAIEQIVSSILVSVRSSIDVDSSTRRTQDHEFWTEEVREQIRVTSQQEDLPGTEVVERWVHPSRGDVYVLVRVSRESLMDRWLPGVAQAASEAKALLATADESAQVDPGRAIRDTLQAYRVVSAAYGDAVKAKVVARDSAWRGAAQTAFAQASQLLADTSARLARLVGDVRIQKVSGDGQQGIVHGQLPTPLRVHLEYRHEDGGFRPLVDLPVRFVPENPDAVTLLATSTTTDSAGDISCVATDLLPTGRSANEIAVQADFKSVAPDLSDSHIPAVVFTYHMPTAGQTRVVVMLEESVGDQVLQQPVLEDGLAAYLSGFGFDVRPPGDARGHLDTTDPTLLRLALGADVDYLIRGRAYARYSSFDRDLHWYRAAAQLKIIHLDTGRVTAIQTADIKEAKTARSETGGIRALKMLRGPIQAELEGAFVADFVPASALEP